MNRTPNIILMPVMILTLGLSKISIAKDRLFYIAADEIEWDYAPSNMNRMMGTTLGHHGRVYVEQSESRIGKKYKKAVYREYNDATFTTLKPRPPKWQHLGILGPIIRAEVGDTINVIFRNNASRPNSVHPHGVFYEKHSEGAPYADGTSGRDKEDDAVAPGKSHTYIWKVPERAGPGPSDPSSIAWLYHGHVKAVNDSNSGLVGPILITSKGNASEDGSPKDVNREIINLFTIFDENESWYLDDNIRKFTKSEMVDRQDDEFIESNLMHAINGYIYANLPGLEMISGERVRWYLMSLGTEVDLHTPHWHGNTVLMSGNRVDVVELMPASMKVVDMIPDNEGIWMYHCHVNDHIKAGMTALYTVRNRNGGD